MKGLASLVVFVSFQLALGHQRVSYKGYKTYHVTPKTKAEADIIHNLEVNPKYDFWLEPRALNSPATVMVTPDEQANFEQLMKNHNIDVDVLIEDVESTIPQLQASPEFKLGDVTFDRYLNHTEINAYIERLAVDYPELVRVEEIGVSYEGRPLQVAKISSGGTGKPAILIDAGIHAREWIASAVALYIIYQLVENSTNAAMSKDIDWIILPMVNPDGYEYSRNVEAMWRKTRKPTTNPSCPGTDGNRNFDHYWMTTGASSDPCSQTYAGPQPNSEPETSAVEALMQLYKATVKLYLSFHSYGGYFLYPWGYTPDPPSNNDELYGLARAVADAILSVGGTNYTVGPSSCTLYPTSGSSVDFAAAEAAILLSYTVELPAVGSTGFHPPPEMILPIAKETAWGGIKFHDYIYEKFVT